ncbi:hypothetical protein KIPB_001279 [Kipferlia bialata]|uniref:MPN domain-containing protein n=1 Tax=Kipferlia bialata TaxID=797122 RepID=A0A391NRZ5_9EUKA|nr:hypothetical protein KIPB_001279 [Kipferlia bialata]|eukprot:g1279.t1
MSAVGADVHVTVRPTVLLQVADHYDRQARGAKHKRVVGMLLGERRGDSIIVNDCFAVPFDENQSDANVWFFDSLYSDTMADMHRKIHAKTLMVGWYSTADRSLPQDSKIHSFLEDRYGPLAYVAVNVSIDMDADQESVRAYR